MRTELLMATAISLCLVSCSDNGGAIDAPNPPIPEPEEVTITINHDKIRLAVGETVPIDFSVEPEDAPLEWNSSDSRIATVDGNGNVTAIARGSVSVTASSGTAKTSVPVIVERAIAVGDYYYSDGTTSDAIISGKTILGVVFWLGNATTDDAALRRDHPECTHGLAVAAFSELNPSPWQSTCNTYNSTTGSWVENNVGDLYQSPVSLYQRDTRRSMTLGYNNTKALEAFNAANPSYLVEAIQAVHTAADTLHRLLRADGFSRQQKNCHCSSMTYMTEKCWISTMPPKTRGASTRLKSMHPFQKSLKRN